VRQVYAAGANAYLHKPVESSQFAEVMGHLGRSRRTPNRQCMAVVSTTSRPMQAAWPGVRVVLPRNAREEKPQCIMPSY
jgi:hypothetical protein